MVHELNLKPGWLSADMEKAAERVREWTIEKNCFAHEEPRSQNASGLTLPAVKDDPKAY